MAKITTMTETETGHGWEYVLAVEGPSNTRTEHTVRLSWADHEHWSGGRDSPSRVVEKLVGLLVERGQTLPPRFDASTGRRWWPGLDDAMRGGWS